MLNFEFDAESLKTDPGRIALGDNDDALQAAVGTPSPNGAACQAATAAFRTALTFRALFTTLVVFLSAAATLLLILTLYRISEGWDATATASLAGTVVTGTAAGFVIKQMNAAIRVQNRALADVGKYCGEALKSELASR